MKLVHLYDYNYKGCVSCSSCKVKNGDSYGRCATGDDLLLFLREAAENAAILVGSLKRHYGGGRTWKRLLW